MSGRVSIPALERLRRARGFVFDLDGTLAAGDARNQALQPKPRAAELLALLDAREIPFVIFTNGTVRPVASYVPRLAKMDFPVDESRVMTPSTVAADYFIRQGLSRIMTLGGEGVWEPLVEAGLEVVHSPTSDPGRVDAVWVGWYHEFGMADIETATRAIEGGAGLYSASGTPWFSTRDGRALGTSMVICGALEAITGVRAKVLGKPSVEGLNTAARRLGVPLEDIVVVGDDARLEVVMAHLGGCVSVYIDSGVSGADPFVGVPEAEHPHFSLAHTGELLELLLAA